MNVPREVLINVLEKHLRERFKEINAELIYIGFVKPIIVFRISDLFFAVKVNFKYVSCGFEFKFEIFKIDNNFSLKEMTLFPKYEPGSICIRISFADLKDFLNYKEKAVAKAKELKEKENINTLEGIILPNIEIDENENFSNSCVKIKIINEYLKHDKNFELWLNEVFNLLENTVKRINDINKKGDKNECK